MFLNALVALREVLGRERQDKTMSEPIKLDASEVEFWKACYIKTVNSFWADTAGTADLAVMALRERTPQLMHGVDSWMECEDCGRKIEALVKWPKENFVCCNKPMHVHTKGSAGKGAEVIW